MYTTYTTNANINNKENISGSNTNGIELQFLQKVFVALQHVQPIPVTVAVVASTDMTSLSQLVDYIYIIMQKVCMV